MGGGCGQCSLSLPVYTQTSSHTIHLVFLMLTDSAWPPGSSWKGRGRLPLGEGGGGGAEERLSEAEGWHWGWVLDVVGCVRSRGVCV